MKNEIHIKVVKFFANQCPFTNARNHHIKNVFCKRQWFFKVSIIPIENNEGNKLLEDQYASIERTWCPSFHRFTKEARDTMQCCIFLGYSSKYQRTLHKGEISNEAMPLKRFSAVETTTFETKGICYFKNKCQLSFYTCLSLLYFFLNGNKFY